MKMPIRFRMKFLLNTASLMFILAISSPNVSCIRNFALNKFAYQSSTLAFNGFQWTADKAVDGNINGSNPNNSSTCSATHVSQGNHTWEVDIGFQIIVKTITVYGRTDVVSGPDHQLSGFQVFVGNKSNPWTSDPPLAKQGSSNSKHVFASINSVGRFVSVVRWNQTIMTLCEVMVEGECLDGMFSAFCNLTCGKCNEGRPCDKDNGTCPTGCHRGLKGIKCDMPCENGTYGSGCEEICGHCMRGNNSCSTTDGHCKEGCQEGWKGEKCNILCESGTYGPGCKEICGNCLNGSNSCSTKDGKCMGGCIAGYKGDTCKLGMRNFAFNKFAYQSSTVFFNGFQWTADKAVDGNSNGSNPGNSRTCSATNNSLGNHTWEVDIGFQIMVKTIIVYERTTEDDQLSGFQVFVGNNSNTWTSNPPLAKQKSSNHKHVFASINYVGRFVSVVRWNSYIMTLCEVVVEGECLDGMFSEFCNLSCGTCNEGRPCDKDSGECPSGCDRGWKGTRCDMRIQDTASTGINPGAIGGIVGTIIVVVVMTTVVIALVKWKRRRMKTNKTTQLGAIETHHKENENSETYCNIGNYVSEGNFGYSKANANTALDKSSPTDYELGDTAQNDASVYSVINDAAIESRKKGKVNSSVQYAQQLLSIEKEMNAVEKKKNDLILKKKKILNKLATSESIAK